MELLLLLLFLLLFLHFKIFIEGFERCRILSNVRQLKVAKEFIMVVVSGEAKMISWFCRIYIRK